MISRLTCAPLLRRFSLAVAATGLAAPAFAHHMGPSGVGAGGGMTVFGPGTIEEGHGSAWLRLFFTQPDRRSDNRLEALANRDVDAHNTRYDLNGAIGAAFGVTPQLTISIELPYLRHDSIRVAEIGDGVERLGSAGGVGDLTLLAKYRLTAQGPGGVALIGGIKAPTGNTHERDRLGDRLETEHQPGTGSWDPIIGASAGTKLGQMHIAASAVYQVAGRGAQQTRLGDRLDLGVALSHHFGPTEEEEHHHGGHEHGDEPHVHTDSWDAFVEFAGELEGRQQIGGEVERDSGGKWAWVAPGVTFNAAAGWSASAAVAIPVWQRIRPSHPNNAYRLMLSIGHSL